MVPSIKSVDANLLLRRGSSQKKEKEAEAGEGQALLLGLPHLDVDKVVRSIADYVWFDQTSKFKDQPPQKFIVAGSYPSAAKAHEYDKDLVLPYNDIDVFVQTQYKCNGRIKQVYYTEGVIPHSDIQVNFVHVCDLDLEDMVEGFDINAIMIGFEVFPVYDRKAHKLVPQVHWHWDPAFDNFLHTQTLEVIREGQGRYAGSLIRLLYKAQQSGGKYKIWEKEKLMNTLHGSTFSPTYKKKLDKLVEPYKSELYSRFEVWEVRKKTYMLVLKGVLPPLPDPETIVRSLQQDEYDAADDDEPEPQIFVPPTAPFAVPPGTFLISSTASGLYLTVIGDCRHQSDITVESLIRSNSRQLFKHGPSNSIESVHCPGLVLDIDASQCDPGHVILWPRTGNENQAFDILIVDGDVGVLEDGFCGYLITNVGSAGEGVRVLPPGVMNGGIPATQEWLFQGDYQ